ncbi:AcrR family transcriptional regulator [Streptomyces griseochromogenes]|uniref:AcrR family transcriptional regulator n=2 Tax=Streptomyces griseochromogenes TaxID=68214 RepID=A0ABS4LIG6_9ACTN|nr:TetR/AcrR family transcriptional regulator [Streptomyces griseochromogenes]MBP2047174.1 AcrR family transcriptional regulator [Streptomyces griseochromogenes]
MSPRRSDSRERMISSAAVLLGEQGAGATSIDRVLAHSGAPRGSVYHHFPDGRAQLIDEAVVFAGDVMAARIAAAASAGDPVAAIDSFFALWRDRLAGSDFRAGCPIVAAAVAADDEGPRWADSAAVVFARWQETLAALFVAGGLPRTRGRRLATFVIGAVEGAVVMCRAERSLAPLDAAAAEIRDLLLHALPDRSEPPAEPGKGSRS